MWRNQIAEPHLGRIDTQDFRRAIYDAFHHQYTLRPARATHGSAGREIGVRRVDLGVDVRDFVRADNGAHRNDWRYQSAVQPQVVGENIAQPEDLARVRESQFDGVDLLAFLSCADEVLVAIFDPLYGAIQIPRQPAHQRVLRVDATLWAETAADVRWSNHPDLLLRHAENVREEAAYAMRCLRGRPHGKRVQRFVVAGSHTAALH